MEEGKTGKPLNVRNCERRCLCHPLPPALGLHDVLGGRSRWPKVAQIVTPVAGANGISLKDESER